MKILRLLPLFLLILVYACQDQYAYLGLQRIDTGVKCVSDFVEMTDTSVFVHSETLGGLGQKINSTGHRIDAFSRYGDYPPIYFYRTGSNGSRSHDLILNYTTDTVFVVKAMARINDTTLCYGEELIIDTYYEKMYNSYDNYKPNNK